MSNLLIASSNGTVTNASELRDSPFLVRHSGTFQSLLTNPAHTYRYQRDEALRASPEDARAMRRDGWIRRLLRERVEPVALSKWHIEGEDDKDPREKVGCELLTKIIKRIPRFARLRMKLRECNWFGVYGVQNVVGRVRIDGVSRFCVTNWLPVHGDKLVPRHDGVPGLLILGNDRSKYEAQGYTVKSTERGYILLLDKQSLRDRFIIDTFDIDDADYYEPDLAGSIFGTGLRGEIQWLWWLQAELISQVMDFLARIGAGGLTVLGYEEGNPKSFEQAQTTGKELESNNVLLVPFPKGTSKQANVVERIEPNVAGAQFIIDIATSYYDTKIERCIIGQTASSRSDTGNKLGSQNTDLQGDTKYQIIKSDAVNQDETLTTDLVAVLARWNGLGDTHYRFVTDISEPGNEKKLEAVNKAYGMGVAFVEDEVRQLTGLGKPGPDDKVLSNQQQGMPGLPGMGGLPGGLPGGDAQAGGAPGAGAVGTAAGAGGPASGGEPGSGAAVEEDASQNENSNDDGARVPGDESSGEGVHASDSTDPADDESSPDIQQFFQSALDSGDLFTPEGLKRLSQELEGGSWKAGQKVQYARAQWTAYRNPDDGRSGWKSAGGRVVYEDPTHGPEEHPHGRKGGGEDEGGSGQGAGQGQGESANKPAASGPGERVRQHVGVERGRAGDLPAIQKQLGEMLDDPASVTPNRMRGIVSALMGLTVPELNQLRQQYGGKRGRKQEMVAGLGRRLQDEGLPAPAEPRPRVDIDAGPAVAAGKNPETGIPVSGKEKPNAPPAQATPSQVSAPNARKPAQFKSWATAKVGDIMPNGHVLTHRHIADPDEAHAIKNKLGGRVYADSNNTSAVSAPQQPAEAPNGTPPAQAVAPAAAPQKASPQAAEGKPPVLRPINNETREAHAARVKAQSPDLDDATNQKIADVHWRMHEQFQKRAGLVKGPTSEPKADFTPVGTPRDILPHQPMKHPDEFGNPFADEGASRGPDPVRPAGPAIPGPAAGGSAGLAPTRPSTPPSLPRPAGPAKAPGSVLERIRARQKALAAPPAKTAAPVAPRAAKPAGLTPEPNRAPVRAEPTLSAAQQRIKAALDKTGGNQSQAAKQLGVSREAIRQVANRIKAKLGGAPVQSAAADVTAEGINNRLLRMESMDSDAVKASLPAMTADYDKNIVAKHVGARHKAANQAEKRLNELMRSTDAANAGGSPQLWDEVARLHALIARGGA